MITACIVCLYISYSIPVLCLLLRGRNNIPHGPFWMGPIGLVSNIVLLLWTSFTLIMYSFPPVLPVQAGSKSFSNPSRKRWVHHGSLGLIFRARYELRLRRLRDLGPYYRDRLVRAREAGV